MFRFLLIITTLLLTFQTISAQEFFIPEELADDNGQFILVNDVSIYYVAEGDPENPIVILIHGFGGSTFTWRDTLPALADAGFYAVALDLPPFGLSDKNPELDYSRSGMADIVDQFMDAMNIPTATIVGHSMGGSVTAQLAVRHSERIEKLVFVAGGVVNELPDENETTESDENNSPLSLLDALDPASPATTLLLRTIVTRDFFVDTIKDAYYNPEQVTDDVADGYARLLLIEDAPTGFLAYVQATETNPITLDNLVDARNDVPIMLIWGEQDTWVPIEVGQAMFNEMPDAQFVTYENVGHLPMEENVAQFNADLIAFLSE